jgi:predicted dehydrogenase
MEPFPASRTVCPASPPAARTNPSILGPDLHVLAIIDPDVSRAHSVLAQKRLQGTAGYVDTQVYSSVDAYSRPEQPEWILIGVPPALRGTLQPGRNMELVVCEKFPSGRVFVEKPLSSSEPEEVKGLGEYFRRGGRVVVVGYMSRCLSCTSGVGRRGNNGSGAEGEENDFGEGDYYRRNSRDISSHIPRGKKGYLISISLTC